MFEPIDVVYETEKLPVPAEDFVTSANHQMYSLYLLSLLLTADHDKAEQCVISAIGEYVERIGPFVGWENFLTRRAVIRQAIRMIQPVPEHIDHASFICSEGPATPEDDNPFGAILLLGPFERFVFVMSILEKQSAEECATLLGCSRRDVMMARVLAAASVQQVYSPDWDPAVLSPLTYPD